MKKSRNSPADRPVPPAAHLRLVLENFGDRFATTCDSLDQLLSDPQLNRARIETLNHFGASAPTIPAARRSSVIRAVSDRSVSQALEARLVSPSELVALGHCPDLLSAVLKSRHQQSIPASLWRRFLDQIPEKLNPKLMISALVLITGFGCYGIIQNSQAQAQIGQLRVEYSVKSRQLDQLEQQIKAARLHLVVVPGTDVITVSGDAIRLSAVINTDYIEKVMYRFGTEPDGKYETAVPDDMQPDPVTGLVRFSKTSSRLPRTNKCVKVELKFIPKADVVRRFPEFFAPERLQFIRPFFLGSDGIEADVEPVEVTEVENDDGRQLDRSEVGRVAVVKGRVHEDGGHPVVFVRPLATNQVFWVQDPVTEVTPDGRFNTLVRCGNESTPVDTKYEILIAVAPNKAEAVKLVPGQQLSALPASWVKSRPVYVTRK